MDYSGQRFEHYQLIEKLGQGGMATVYKAYDTRLERDVAIKVVRKESIPPEQLERILKRFEREAKALARFIHPNIVPVHDYGEFQGAPFLVMAYLPGGTLKDRIGKPLPVQTALGYVIPIASALSYAHQRGVIHRDVKPGNILTTEDGALMLSDFGIAQILEEATTQLTGTGLGVGTPEYMAPEQWQGKASAASDQYALGVVLFELLTGRKPFSAETPLAVALKVMSEPLPRPRDLAPEIPEELEKVLYKTLARDPQDRYENIEEFALALRRLLAEADTAEPILPQKERRKPRPAPATQASDTSESVTRDALDTTPAEGIRTVDKTVQPKKRALPNWALLAGVEVIGLVIGIGGNMVMWFGGAYSTIMQVPVIIGAVLEGPLIGLIVGLLFGVFSMIQAVVAPTGSFIDVWFTNPLVSILPRLFIGPIAWLIYRGLKRWKIPALIAAGIGGSLTNTVFGLGMIGILGFMPWADLLRIMLIIGLPEGVVSAVLVVAVVSIWQRIEQKGDKKGSDL